MVNNRFEAYKIKREIKRNGTELEFFRPDTNEFGEPGELKPLIKIKGFYHEHKAHILDTYMLQSGDMAGITRFEKTPQLLCMYKDCFFTPLYEPEPVDGEEPIITTLKIGDVVDYNGMLMKVTGVWNVMEWNLIMDISFEEVEDGQDYPTQIQT